MAAATHTAHRSTLLEVGCSRRAQTAFRPQASPAGRASCTAHSLSFGASAGLGTWSTERVGVPLTTSRQHAAATGVNRRQVTRMGNKATSGPFSPLVNVVRNAMGKKEFNQFRGKAISLHSQVIKEFGKTIGADNKLSQAVIRLAKKNGEKLGFLA